MDFDKIISSIPDYKVFMTMDELDASSLKLAEEYPDTIEIRNIGNTKEGRPLYCLKAGRGSRNALVMGCPHPNEPIGTLMIESLAQTLAEHPEYFEELDYTFYMIKAIDPDGLVRNEGWLKGPFTYYNYARNYFRPAASQQVEWSFPLSYKTLDFNDPIPETQAVMKLIHEIKPSFIYSLHNSGFSGAFWYIHSKDRDKLARAVQKLPLIPEKYNSFLHRGEPETAACEQYGDAVYQMINQTDIYDYYKTAMPDDDPADYITSGTSSVEYTNMNVCSCESLVSEIGYFKTELMQDTSDAGCTRGEAMRYRINAERGLIDFINSVMVYLEKYLPETDQYRLALDEFRFAMQAEAESGEFAMTQAPEEYEKPATVAQWFDGFIGCPYEMDLFCGAAATALENAAENAEGEVRKEILDIVARIEKDLRDKTERIEKQVPCVPCNIRDLVAYQMESGLVWMTC